MDLKKALMCVPLLLGIGLDNSLACSRVLRVDQDNAVMVGRTMDWKEDMKTNLVVYPRGMKRSGGMDSNPVQWTSLYGSLVATVYEHISSDGMNEAGLGAHMLWLKEADFGTRDPKTPGLSVALWVQYYLDNFKTVADAVRFSESGQMQLTPMFHPGTKRWINVHLALEDESGDSAILEYVDGKLKVYHDKKYLTLTNDPSYDRQIVNLSSYQAFGGDKPLPGTNSPSDRFVRATYYVGTLPKASSAKEEMTQMLSILNNVSQPYSTPSELNPYDAKTIWRVVTDLTDRTYYYQSMDSQNLLMVSLERFNLAPNAPVMQLDLVRHPEYTGDVSDKFEPLEMKATA
ncbi:linear amide C-N hydrolase [Legionella sp. CNM-4043-24]|uniref:linear amide C-N hydrolase n=1 Tax=Legionella sp. CNM-4043-24 TaxID=3421646 RepID=UPI00403B1958